MLFKVLFLYWPFYTMFLEASELPASGSNLSGGPLTRCYFQSLCPYFDQFNGLYCPVTDSSALKGDHQKGLPLRMDTEPASEMQWFPSQKMETIQNEKSALSKLYTAE